MSPLWSDLALARAGWADAVKRGLVNDCEPRGSGLCDAKDTKKREVGSMSRSRLNGCAL